jgi:hypothetical protein
MAAIEIDFSLPKGFLDAQGSRDGFILLAAFLASFLFIRTSARLMRSPRVPWWPGSVTTGSGLHLHHLVWGIVLLLLSGFLSIALNPAPPVSDVFAALFGVGAGLTLDEFALWIHLEDVYWAEEGRSSLDAVVVATLIGGLIVLGLSPFGVSDPSAVATLIVTVAIDVALCVLVILKGKPLLALIGLFVPPLLLPGAVRLASPASPWGRWRYGADSPKRARSEQRFARIRQRRRRAADLIAGAPTPPT